jgi:alpha-L-fucosidase
MATASYNKNSAYYGTPTFGQFLDVLDYRPITTKPDDVVYTVDAIYQFRPDMLAFDLYGDSGLWWVFAARNPNVIEDPLLDFRAGATIYIPNKTTLTTDLGI